MTNRLARAWLVSSLGFAACTAPAVAGTTLDHIRDRSKIVVAYREASVPFSYVDASGRPMGYAIDLCRRLTEAVSKKLGI